MTMHAGWAIRIAIPISALVAPATAASCSSYDEYSLRQSIDASTPLAGGSGGKEAGTAGRSSGGGGLAPATGGRRPLEASTHEEAGSSLPDSSIDGVGGKGGGRDATVDGDAISESLRPPPLADIVDGATLYPVPSVSSCGWRGGLRAGMGLATVVDFGCPDAMQDFMFFDAGPVVPGVWQYVATGDPHITEVANAQSFTTRGVEAVVSGAKALYMPNTVHDGFVSVRTWSSDNDMACLIARYQDELHYYRLCLSYSNQVRYLVLWRIMNTDAIEVGRAEGAGSGHASGHILGLNFVGQTFRVSLTSETIAEYEDPGGYSFGRVGIEDILLADAHFDEFTVVTY